MNLIFIIILFSSFICSQTSSLTLYGLGERIHTYDTNASSLGDSRLFSSNTNGFILSSPSSYYNNYQANLSMSIAFNRVNALATDGLKNKLESSNFSHFSFGFPITKNQYFLLSVNPVFRSFINFKEKQFNYLGANSSFVDTNNDGLYDPIKYRKSFDVSGGISEISSAISSRINENISVGFKVGKLFGTRTIQDTLSFYKVEYDQTGNELNDLELISYEPRKSKYNYSSMSYMLDMRFSVLDHSHLAFYFGKSSRLKIDENYDNYQQIETSASGYIDYGIGFKSNIYDNFGYILEFQNFDSFKFNNTSNTFIRPSLDMQSTNFGLFFIYDKISSSRINCMKFNFGFYDKIFKQQNNFNNIPILTDLAITFGIGIEYLNNNSYDISFTLGKRSSEFSEFNNEKYFKLNFSLISNNDWFVKERN